MTTMKLLLMHGRTGLDKPTDVDGNEVDDWGFDGPTIEGIKAVHYTYGNPVVWFDTNEAAEAAHRLTRWEYFDEGGLEMEFREDLVQTYNAERERLEYFGDWEFQTKEPMDPPDGEPLKMGAAKDMLLGGYSELHDGLSDMIENGRLIEADIPDDYRWLVDKLVAVVAANDRVVKAKQQPDKSAPEGDPGRPVRMVCATCGSDNVLADAFAEWDVDNQCWTVQNVFDKGHACESCGDECSIEEVEIEQ